MTDQIRAPWTPEQVAALNAFQREGGMHPFTCGYEHPAHPNPILQATKNGWRCYVIGCDWEQDWAHAFMADPDAWPKFPFGERHGPTPEESRASVLVQVGWYCWRCRAVNAQACRSDNVPVHVPAEWADEMRAEIARREDEDDEQARTTPDNGAASGDTADNLLRERLKEAEAQCQEWENTAYRHAKHWRDEQEASHRLLAQRQELAAERFAWQERGDQLAAALRETLDAFEMYWARASYEGPGEHAVEPEQFQAWHAVLNGKEQP